MDLDTLSNSKLCIVSLHMACLLATETNSKSLGVFFSHIPLLSTQVARQPRPTWSLVSLAQFPASVALLASRSLVSGLSPLSHRLRLYWPLVPTLRLPLLPSMSLQLHLSPPGISLQLSQCPIRCVRQKSLISLHRTLKYRAIGSYSIDTFSGQNKSLS